MQEFQVGYTPGKPLVFSPDGRYLAVRGRALTLLDATGGPPQQVTALDTVSREHAFIDNGAAIAYAKTSDGGGGGIVSHEIISGATRERRWVESGVSALTAD